MYALTACQIYAFHDLALHPTDSWLDSQSADDPDSMREFDLMMIATSVQINEYQQWASKRLQWVF